MARSNNSLPAFLLALRKSLVTANVAADECCQITMEDDFPSYPMGTPIIFITPGELRAIDEGGEGEAETIFKGTLRYRLFIQSVLDNPTTDVAALTDNNTTVGLYVLFQNLLQIARFWDLGDDGGNAYLQHPMRLTGGLSKPKRDDEHQQYVYADLNAEFVICIGKGASGK